MTLAHRRRRPRLTRSFARSGGVMAVCCAGAAITVEGPWSRIAAAAGALVSVALAAAVLRLERRRRIEVTAVRAAVTAEYAALRSAHADEQRAFTVHMVRLLDTASERIALLRRRLDATEADVRAARADTHGKSGNSAPQLATGMELTGYAAAGQWDDIWPELADAATVVDLIRWNERSRPSAAGPPPPVGTEQSSPADARDDPARRSA